MSFCCRPVRSVEGGIHIDVWVVPNARRPGLDGLHDGAVRVRVAAPPEGGRANQEAAAMLAAVVGGCHGRVVKGGAARRKVVEVGGTDLATAVGRLRGEGVPL